MARSVSAGTHVDGEYIARMEDVLDLYAEAPEDLKR
jgi:hypothetical protein